MFVRTISLLAALIGGVTLPALADTNVALRGAGNDANEAIFFDEDARDLAGCVGPPSCNPKLHFASKNQALCDPENNFYAEVTTASEDIVCKVNFQTVLILADLEGCTESLSIRRIRFDLYRDGVKIAKRIDTAYPYAAFGDDPATFKGRSLLTGNYRLEAKIIDQNLNCLWSGVFAFAISDVLCNDEEFCATTSDYNGHKYLRIEQALTYQDAKCFATEFPPCCGKIAHLATITSGAENTHVSTVCDGTNLCWIGLDDMFKEIFVWVTGEAVTFTNWNVGEPNNEFDEDCTEINRSIVGKWNDIPCTGFPRLSVAEYDCQPE